MSLSDALDRIDQIQSRITALTGAPAATTVAPAAAAPATPAAPAAASFSDALASAQAAGQPPPAAGLLTAGQQAFVSRLAARTGLDPRVVSSWVLAEESGDAARARQAANNNDWLNIGYTGSATYGADAAIWNDPLTAADATAGWLQGQATVPGYGPASAGVRSILSTAGLAPEAQIAALQRSGWAAGGYPSLPAIYRTVAATAP
jgi:hypothetical protein